MMFYPIFGNIRKALINRRFTSIIHYFIDNWVPPIIRDSRFFMLPLFKLAYRNKNVQEYMEFKSRYFVLDRAELEILYQHYESIGTERETDLTPASVTYILNILDTSASSVLDVACGRGFLATQLVAKGYKTVGADVLEQVHIEGVSYKQANIESLPFADKAFDIVISTHTLEHVINIRAAAEEIKRVARKQIIIVVPCQRFFYYTLDLHLHFFPRKEMLINLMGMENYSINKIRGDWVYIGYPREANITS